MADSVDNNERRNKKDILKSDDALVNKIIANVEEDLHAGRQAASKALNPELYSDVNKKAPTTQKP